jgi:hypothetical protein
MPIRTLANRLSVHVLHDLASTCPKSVLSVERWLEHVAFWLADLASHPNTPDQVHFMIGHMGVAMSTHLGWPLQDACRELKDQLQLHQLNKELQS